MAFYAPRYRDIYSSFKRHFYEKEKTCPKIVFTEKDAGRTCCKGTKRDPRRDDGRNHLLWLYPRNQKLSYPGFLLAGDLLIPIRAISKQDGPYPLPPLVP